MTNIEEFASEHTGPTIQDLYTELVTTCLEIDKLWNSMEQLEKQDPVDVEQLEKLYENEFLLYMKNIGAYEDLLLAIERTEKTIENEFELARIKKEAEKLVRVEVVYV